MSDKLNFLGALQPVRPVVVDKDQLIENTAPMNYEALPRVCGRGQCMSHADAKQQLKVLFKREYPEYAGYIDDERCCFGGVFVFDCTPYELMEKAADNESMELIRKMYEEAVELAPLTD
jgi:hypothetical protein